MRKRKFGYLLLISLVVSGIAGTPGSTTITQSERKQAVTQLKQTRSALLKITEGLSEKQLSFKPSVSQQSIKEFIYLISLAEKESWQTLQTVMNESPGQNKVTKMDLSGNPVLNLNTTGKLKYAIPSGATIHWANTQDALASFKVYRNKHIQYTRTTTEDLRHHFLATPKGTLDAYEVLLSLSASTDHLLAEIETVKSNPRFPKK